MTGIQQVSEAEFEKFLLESKCPLIVEFGAKWCAPCKRMKPVIDGLAEKWNGRAQFLEVDVDESQSLTMRYQVMSVPTLILIREGSIKSRLIGFQPDQRIMNEFGPWIGA